MGQEVRDLADRIQAGFQRLVDSGRFTDLADATAAFTNNLTNLLNTAGVRQRTRAVVNITDLGNQDRDLDVDQAPLSTVTVSFNDMRRITAGGRTIDADGWVAAANPQRNPTTGALEWVFTRVEDQDNGNEANDTRG